MGMGGEKRKGEGRGKKRGKSGFRGEVASSSCRFVGIDAPA
jgi:hypothetical protein